MGGSRGTAVIRADASPAIGGGHVVRSLALADGLAARGWHCLFATIPAAAATVPALGESGHEVIELRLGEDSPEALERALPCTADWLVTDHYGIDAGFHRAARRWARRIAVIDELLDRPLDCDLVIDQTPDRARAEHDGRIPGHARALIGPRYALLRPEFAAGRAHALRRRRDVERARRVLVSFGAVDARNLATRALEGLHASGIEAEVDVVVGGSAPHADAVAARVREMPFPVSVHHQVGDMAALMANADLALGAAGTTSWERCCLGLPALVIVDADNQAQYAERLQAGGAARVLGTADAVGADDIATALTEIGANPDRLREMAGAAAGMCDGRGVQRVVDAMEDG